WIEEEPKEDPEMEEEEEEEEEIDIEDKMDDPEIINPYEIEKGELPPPPADSDTFADSEPEVEAEDEDGDEATAAIERLITQRVNAALEAERAGQVNKAGGRKQLGRNDAISCNDLCHFVKQCNYVLTLIMPPKAISQAAIERLITQRVNATLEAERAGLNVAIGKSWGDMKKMMLEEFCPDEEVQRMEDELRSLKLRDMNIAAYTQRFHELVLLCPEAVPTEKKKIKAYIKGFPENIKGETTSS
nr:reverse transcriptase domain-containing protein [Tanacetum cinerariifolium]